MQDFEVYADELSIIYGFSMTDCPPDILLGEVIESCKLWLCREHPKCACVGRTIPLRGTFSGWPCTR
jgi:hypothetical protein